MAKPQSKEKLLALLKEASEVFKTCSRKAKILSALAWKAEVAEEFFAKKESVMPKPVYTVDTKSITECIEALTKLTPRLAGEHPVKKWLQRSQESYINGCELLLSLETDRFYELSTKLYGNSQTRFFNGQTSNLDLANAISTRLSVCTLNDMSESMVRKDTQQFATGLEEKLKARVPPIPVRVEITDQIVAKVVAGMNRVRVRKDAHFGDLELQALWNHEIESHCLTAHNGALQENCDFLSAGGPRTTMTSCLTERLPYNPAFGFESTRALISVATISTLSSNPRSASSIASESGSSPVAQAADQMRGRRPSAHQGARKESTKTSIERHSRKK